MLISAGLTASVQTVTGQPAPRPSEQAKPVVALPSQASQPPASDPRIEAALRHMIEAIAQGKPDFAAMTGTVAEHLQKVSTGLRLALQGAGAIQSITPLVKSDDGQLVYAMAFEKGSNQFAVRLNNAGLIDAFSYGPHLADALEPIGTLTPNSTAGQARGSNNQAAASPVTYADRPHLERYCHGINSTTGLVISPNEIEMDRGAFFCFGSLLGCDYRGAGGRYHCPITINVELANAADADKMPLGRLVTLYGRFELWRAKNVYFVIMKNAKLLYADPFGR